MRYLAAGILMLWLGLISVWTFADTQLRSQSHWLFEAETVEIEWGISSKDSARLLSLDRADDERLSAAMIDLLKDGLLVQQAQHSCGFKTGGRLHAAPEKLRVQLRYHCADQQSPVVVNLQRVFQLAPQHVHFARITLPSSVIDERLLTVHQPRFSVPLKSASNAYQDGVPSSASVFSNYMLFGFEHILAGYDHLAFLAALMLLVRRQKELLLLITGFTLGHSITLMAAALSWIVPDIGWVEALIGFSIALVAAENTLLTGMAARRVATLFLSLIAVVVIAQWGNNEAALVLIGLALFSWCYLRLSEHSTIGRRLLVAVLFGLIHGFGFASVLSEVGLPQTAVLNGLMAFNLGVELGQILVVFVMTVPILVVSRFDLVQRQLMQQCAASFLCGLGVYWFVSRAMI